MTLKKHGTAWGVIIRILPLVSLALAAPLGAQAQDRLPIIDMHMHMHMHAYAAHENGPPPVGVCVPFGEFPNWDPTQPYDAVFMAMLKEPPCSDPVWSPGTDDEVMNETIAVMHRRNVIGVLSESPDRVSTWRAAAPDRFTRM